MAVIISRFSWICRKRLKLRASSSRIQHLFIRILTIIWQAVQHALNHELSIVKGELRSQRTDGWSTLVNTASARVYLKQMNQLGQAMLEKVAEPLAAFAHVLGVGKKYPHHLFTYAWKTLMQNHPHDSICGCSVDEVHREMVTRFEKSRHVAEAIVDDSKRAIAETGYFRLCENRRRCPSC